MPPKKASKGQKGNKNAKKARAEPDGPGDDPAVREDGAAARARAHCDRPRLPGHLRLRLHRAHCPVTRRTAAHAPPDRARIARRLTLTLRVVALPHALPHARRADRPIKKKPQGKRNLPANEAVSRSLIIEPLERATPEEIVQLAFVCLIPE